MKKFENLGKKLSKEEQKNIKGGFVDPGGCEGMECAGDCECYWCWNANCQTDRGVACILNKCRHQ